MTGQKRASNGQFGKGMSGPSKPPKGVSRPAGGTKPKGGSGKGGRGC
jgi:hypothetical protein